MHYCLNGWGVPETLAQLRGIGWQKLRFGLPPDWDEAEMWLHTAKAMPQPPLVIIRNRADIRDHGEALAGCDLEWQNEPNGTIDRPYTPAGYAFSVELFLESAVRIGAFPWIGAISNTDIRGQQWLAEMLSWLPHGLPPYGITTHWYPHGRSQATPHPGFSNRFDELQSLWRIVKTRRWAVSEFGFHTALQRKRAWLPWWFPKNTYRWSDSDVARMAKREFDFLKMHGAEFACLYQITDGPTDTKEDRFGIMRLDGTFKPSAWTP
jgi:hypothetical protein